MDKLTAKEIFDQVHYDGGSIFKGSGRISRETVIEVAERYAAQEVEEECAEQTKNFLKIVDQLNSLENKLAEVTRQRDELKEKVLDILPRLAEGCRESYYFRGIKEIDQAHCLIEELENEKKDGDNSHM